jgi:hypothetical protein
MTAEERMACFYQTPVKEKNTGAIFFKIKFFAAVVLFVAFLSLDYTGYQIKGIGSKEIVKEVTTDLDVSKFKEIAL